VILPLFFYPNYHEMVIGGIFLFINQTPVDYTAFFTTYL
jgi:hypothetical protein